MESRPDLVQTIKGQDKEKDEDEDTDKDKDKEKDKERLQSNNNNNNENENRSSNHQTNPSQATPTTPKNSEDRPNYSVESSHGKNSSVLL